MFPMMLGVRAIKLDCVFRACLTAFLLLVPIFCLGENFDSREISARTNMHIRLAAILVKGHGSMHFDAAARSQGIISIALSPDTATVAPGGNVQFTATITNTDKTAVTWSASSGSISGTGLFTAPTQ